ncbi:MAG: hypothetical protein ACRD0O_08920, partial [Acidimicrobiia bacterium]
ARVIDEEVEKILREQEERGRRTLRQHRAGLDAVAAALLEHETLDGKEVGRLVDEAVGRRAGGPRRGPHTPAATPPKPAPPKPTGNGEARRRAAEPS